jgi:hypothetical protein
MGICGSVVAQTHPDPTGEWVLQLGQRNLLVLSLALSGGPNQVVSGSIKALDFQANGTATAFTHIHGAVKTEVIVASSWNGNGLSIAVQSAADPNDKDKYIFTVKDQTHAQLQIQLDNLPPGVMMPPFDLVRATGPSTIATGWDETKTYSPEDDLPSNPEMQRIFEADQKVRQPGAKIDWAIVSKSDAERREATRKLLNGGSLHSADDFTWAAFIFQHGETPDDYLLAHTLMLIAIKKGKADALWMATATLDRYLQSIHQPQIYGTQFLTPPNQPATQEPYNRTLISDALRHQLGVPSQSAQEDQRKQYDAQRAVQKQP